MRTYIEKRREKERKEEKRREAHAKPRGVITNIII
jgi:hypothetical protein